MTDQDADRGAGLATGYADVVVGGQAGSEGKGAVVAHLIRTNDYAAAVRPGSSNAGHTVYANNQHGQALQEDPDRWEKVVHQVLPTALSVSRDVRCYMAPESSFGLDEFFEEYQNMVDRWGGRNAYSRVMVDPKAAVITDHHRHLERDRKLGEDIGSTVHGCGAVRVEKIWRSAGDVRLAEDYEAMARFLPQTGPTTTGRVPALLADHGRDGEAVMIEGTQGALLSMNQSPHWPFTTSRDCTASTFLSSCGLPPSAVRDVWCVFRTYPIRVGGHSGPMDGEEIDFETVAERAGHTVPPVEFTSVTKKKRRIFEWSWDQFEFALELNDPDYLALTFMDYIEADDHGATTWNQLGEETQRWIHGVDKGARLFNGSRVALVKTGPMPEHVIDFRYKASRDADRWWYVGDLPEVGEEFDAMKGTNWFDQHPTGGVMYNGHPGGEAGGVEVADPKAAADGGDG